MTLTDVLTDAYVKNGLLAPGEVLAPELGDYGMREANRLLDQWNVQELFVFTKNILTFPITARTLPTYWFLIGPSSAGTVDFDTARPTRIERANILLTSVNPTQPARLPLQILDDFQWLDEPIPALGTTLPTSLYDDYADPISKLILWPYPTTTANTLELLTWNQIARFAALTDTFQMPPGYEDAFMLTMAERTAEGIREISATLRQDASRARANIRGLNSQAPKISTTDSGMPGQQQISSGNYRTGWPTQIGS